MIIQGKPELGLQKHQQTAYQSVQKAYKTKNKASVVIPTGCGKSFIALQLMADNKDKKILFMAPSNAIKNQMYNYIAKYIVGEEPSGNRPARMIADEYFQNLKIMLYPSLLRLTDEQMEKLNADFIIMDELHRTGADRWGEKVNTLLEQNPYAKILGLTATPDRMDDKNVIDDLFEGNIDYELTLVDALREGIVKAPTYVKCDYALGEYLEGIRTAISNCNDEQKKKELQDKYDKMRRIVDQADGIPELFARNIKKKDGKYIIFCKDKAHMDELINKAKEWFGSIDDNPEIYSVFSGEGYTEKDNRKSIEGFENSKTEHLKLLFSIEMLNEGLHVEDISGVIMARPTDSRIIYLQQLGRALSSDTSREKTIVFDLVNNYLKNNLDAEINSKTNRTHHGSEDIIDGHEEGLQGNIEDIDIFRIQGETKDFLELLNEVQGIIDRSSYLTNARAIKEWIEKSGDTKPPSSASKNEEERRLGRALADIRNKYIKPYMSLEAEERESFRKEHPEIDEVIRIVDEIDANNIPIILKNARRIKLWIEKSGGTKPPSSTSKNEEERQLGTALVRIRNTYIKSYMSLETEDEKERFKEKHPELDEIMDIIQEIDENNVPNLLKNAREIKAWIEASGDTRPPNSNAKNKNEKSLGKKLVTIRGTLIKKYEEAKANGIEKEFREKHPELEEIIEILREIDENNITPLLKNAREIKTWIEKSGDTKPPSSTSKNKEERRLGTALATIRNGLLKRYEVAMSIGREEEFRLQHPELNEVISIVQEIDKSNVPTFLKNAREIKAWINSSGDTKPPSAKGKSKEEIRLAKALGAIRYRLIKPYEQSKENGTEEEFRLQHPELDEVINIVQEIDQSNVKVSPFKSNAMDISNFVGRWRRMPNAKSVNEEERKLGSKLTSIRQNLIKPYLKLQEEAEKEKFREEHPELDEVLNIISSIDMQCGTQKQKELAVLIRQDLEKRKALQEARKLEQDYEHQLSSKIGEMTADTQKQGVDYDE